MADMLSNVLCRRSTSEPIVSGGSDGTSATGATSGAEAFWGSLAAAVVRFARPAAAGAGGAVCAEAAGAGPVASAGA